MSDFDFNSLTDYASSLLSNTQSNAATSSIKNKVNSVSKDSSDDELLSACKQFEAYLWEQIYKEVDKSVNLFGTSSTGSYAGNMVSTFSDTLIQEVASKSVSQGENSLAKTLYEQLKRNYGIGTVAPEEIDAEEASENAAKNGAVSV